jgi:hypothetical protein
LVFKVADEDCPFLFIISWLYVVFRLGAMFAHDLGGFVDLLKSLFAARPISSPATPG